MLVGSEWAGLKSTRLLDPHECVQEIPDIYRLSVTFSNGNFYRRRRYKSADAIISSVRVVIFYVNE